MGPIRYVVETHSADGIIFSRTEPDDPRVRYFGRTEFPLRNAWPHRDECGACLS